MFVFLLFNFCKATQKMVIAGELFCYCLQAVLSVPKLHSAAFRALFSLLECVDELQSLSHTKKSFLG